MTEAIPSDYILAVFIGVSLMKAPFDLIKNANLSNWLVRIFALAFGVLVAELQYYGGVDHPAHITGYAVMVIGLKAGAGAILAYHIGTGQFIGFFDSGSSSLQKATGTLTSTFSDSITRLSNKYAESVVSLSSPQLAKPPEMDVSSRNAGQALKDNIVGPGTGNPEVVITEPKAVELKALVPSTEEPKALVPGAEEPKALDPNLEEPEGLVPSNE